MAIDAQSSERMLRMVPVLTKKRVYVVKTGTIRKFVLGFTVCRGALVFERGSSGYGNGTEVFRSSICCVWKVYRLSHRDFRFCQGSRVLRMTPVLTSDGYFLVKIGAICKKNGGVGIGACVVGGGLCCSCFRSNAASCGARLVCCCGSMAALRFVCCLKGALHEFGRYSAY